MCERILDRIWRWCMRSATMAWAYFLILAGLALDALPFVVDVLNAHEVQAVIIEYAGTYGSHILKVIGVITALARLRTLYKQQGV